MYGVSSPPSRRSVSATCALGASAGWQQVKMRRSRSSFTSPIRFGRLVALVEQRGLGVAVIAGRLTAQAVDGAVAGGRGDPAARVRRQPGRRPPLARDDERLLDHLFGDVDVAEETDQGGDDPAGLLTEDPFEVGAVDGRHVGSGSGSSWNGRTSTGPMQAAEPLAAQRERGVEVGGLDDPEAAELLLRLGERAVGHDASSPSVACTTVAMLGVVEAAAEHPRAGCLELGVERVDLLERLLHLVGRRAAGSSGLWCTDNMYWVMVLVLSGGRRVCRRVVAWWSVGETGCERGDDDRGGDDVRQRERERVVAVGASASTSGTNDSSVSAIVVTTNVRRGRSRAGATARRRAPCR